MGKKLIKIQLYKKDKTKQQIVSNKYGDYILDDICTTCTVEEYLYDESGEQATDYLLDATFLVDNDGLYRCIEEEATLKVLLDYGEELFSIVSVRKTHTKVVVFARQITIIESINSWLDDVRPESKNGVEALTHMQGYSLGLKNIEFESDIKTINTAYYQNQTLHNALFKSDNSFVNRWGGETRRRGYKMILNNRIGTEKNIQIRSGKNLIGFEAITDVENVVTRIKPRAYWGRTIEGFVDSPLINNYKYIRTDVIEYSYIKLASDITDTSNLEPEDIVYDTLEEVRTKLIELANLEYTQKYIDVLAVEYNINFVDLSQTEEYKDFIQMETVELGDVVSVYEEKHNVNIKVRAISRKYNVMSQKLIEMKLSNNN